MSSRAYSSGSWQDGQPHDQSNDSTNFEAERHKAMENAVSELKTRTLKSPHGRRYWYRRVRGPVIGLLILEGWLLLGGIAYLYIRGPTRTFATSYYMATVTFLTIGYGDFSPTTAGGKIFTIFYIIGSLIIQIVVGGYVVSSVASLEADEVPETDLQDHGADEFFKLRPKLMALLNAVIVLVVFILGLTFLLEFTEDYSFLDSFYFAVISLSTVGYGDITPNANRAWFAVYLLFGVLVFGNLISQSIGVVLEVAKFRKMQRFFSRGLTEEMLESMDIHKDGKIHRDEFIIFLLRELDIASNSQISKILRVFASLDRETDGVIDIEDVRRYNQGGGVATDDGQSGRGDQAFGPPAIQNMSAEQASVEAV